MQRPQLRKSLSGSCVDGECEGQGSRWKTVLLSAVEGRGGGALLERLLPVSCIHQLSLCLHPPCSLTPCYPSVHEDGINIAVCVW